MLPTELPPGTTLETLITVFLPAMHAHLVPAASNRSPIVLRIYLEGGDDYALTVRGPELSIGDAVDQTPISWVSLRRETAQMFLDDWFGAGRFRPPPSQLKDWVALTDPRILNRIAMVSGCIEVALGDVDGTRASLRIAMGSAAKKHPDQVDPDVILETTTAAIESVLAGKIGPDEAIANGDVTVQGKKLLGLQFALAVAPFFPKAALGGK